MSILSVDTIQPIGSGSTVTLNATETKVNNFITVGTGASVSSPSSNVLTLGTNSIERLRITSDGHIEQTIGASNVGFDQVAAGDHYISNVANANRADANDHIFVQRGLWNGKEVATMKFRAGADTSNKDDGYITFETSSANNVTERLRITSDGAVMINKTSSFGTVPLQVKGASSGLSDGGQIFDIGTADGSSGTRLAFGVSEDNFGWIRSYESGVGGRDIVFAASDEKMRIDSSGHIGIGTDNPSTSLQGAWNKALVISAGTSNGSMIRFIESSSAAGGTNTGLLVGQHSNNSYIVNYQNGFMSLRTNNTERFRIGDSGQLGIGGATYGSSGQALVSQGSGSAPQWATVASGGASNISFNSGYGIDFSADSHNSGMTSELLDDYEEGTWSAGINIGTATINQTNYVKIGRFVNATCFCAQMSPRNSSSGIQITGLPYAANGTYTAPIGLHRVIGDQGNGYFAYVSSGTTTIDILQNPWSQQGWKSLAHNQIQHASAAYIIIAVSYQTS